MADYSGYRALAQRLITNYGRTLTFRRSTPGAMNVASGRPAASTVVTAVALAFVVPFSDRIKYGADRLAAQLYVKEGERLIYLSATGMTVTGASDYTPAQNDVVVEVIDGQSWKVDRKQTLDPDGSGPILHAVVVKA